MFKKLITLITISLMAVSLTAQMQTPRETEFLANAGTGWLKAGPGVYEMRDGFGVTRIGFGRQALEFALVQADIERDVCMEKAMDSKNPEGWERRVNECDTRIAFLNDALTAGADRLQWTAQFDFTPFFICGSHLDYAAAVSTMRWRHDRYELPGSSIVLVSAIAQHGETVDLKTDGGPFYGSEFIPRAVAMLYETAPGKPYEATLIGRAYFCNSRINDDCFIERTWYCE